MISLIFLAGGSGSRMNSSLPKQYLLLKGQPIAMHSFNTLMSLPQIDQTCVVCDPDYQHFFSHPNKKIQFALPGPRRQDSVFSGLQTLNTATTHVVIHDAARPFVEKKDVIEVINKGIQVGAAALATKAKNTIKQCDPNHHVRKTLERAELFEMQTPQVLEISLLKKGFAQAKKQDLEATDDIFFAEIQNHPAKIILGSEKNFKITTPLDLIIAKIL